jgi:DNA-directed RNA polymerase specialized sigma24 family protein
MKKEWVITQEAFDGLLDWLDSNREQAAQEYEKIRTRLIKIFTCRGCGEADDLADETINRVTSKVDSLARSYSGDPALYFYGVAQKVHLEYLRARPLLQNSMDAGRKPGSVHLVEADNDIEQEYACLEQCMNQLTAENRRLVLDYYQDEKRAKIERRRKLAEEIGIAVNALRIRAHRIRLQLQQCVTACLEGLPAH